MATPSVCTKTGDEGRTRLATGEVVPKSDPRLEALGAVDELMSFLGVARAAGPATERANELWALQKTLFRVGAELTGRPAPNQEIGADDVARLDSLCQRLAAGRGVPDGFVVPGATPAGAALDAARAVARRCERHATACIGTAARRPLQAWLNRISDALWLMARAEDATGSPGVPGGS